jgi:hypothetical protein
MPNAVLPYALEAPGPHERVDDGRNDDDGQHRDKAVLDAHWINLLSAATFASGPAIGSASSPTTRRRSASSGKGFGR